MAYRRWAGIVSSGLVCGAGALLALGCKQSAASSSHGTEIASSLTRSLDFPSAMLINDPLPDTTAPSVTLLPLAPTVVVEPGAASIMALEVDDPDDRDVTATLMQFGEDDQHLRVEVKEGEGHSDVVENDFTAEKALCKDLCNSIFTVDVKEKAELADGKISKGSVRTIVVDCRKEGDPKNCTEQDGKNGHGETLLCGDVTKGEVALSGDHVIDTHLDALTQFSKVEATAALEVKSAFSALAGALALGANGAPADIGSALETRIADHADAGLSLLLSQPGCALRLEQTSLALRACDPDVAGLASLQCKGECEPSVASACKSATMSGCRGSLDAESCDGACLGACEVMLMDPAPCAGTCDGTCDGTCPNSSGESCKGPCTGNCKGTCRQLSSESCMGRCTGFCASAGTGEPACKPPLAPYCSAEMSIALDCPGDCFGDASVSEGVAACQNGAITVARLFPRCVDPLLQLSFAFKMDLSTDEQTSFAMFVHDLNDPLGRLYDAQARIALLKTAIDELSAAEAGEIGDQIKNGLGAHSDDVGLLCAEQRVKDASGWLADKKAELKQLETDVALVVSKVTLVMMM